MKQKKLVLSLLVMLAFLVSGFTYAFWASGVTGNTVNNVAQTVQVGTGEAVTTTVALGTISGQLGTGVQLVPNGMAGTDPLKADTLTLSIPVTWTEDANDEANAAGTTGTLSVAIISVLDGANNVSSHFTITLPADHVGIALGTTVNVSITITLNEPATQALYAAIANKNVSFIFSFTVGTLVTP